MILESFDRRTLANMEVARERVCEGRPDCADHELRAYIADSLIVCARKGQTTIGALTEAGEAALAAGQSQTRSRPDHSVAARSPARRGPGRRPGRGTARKATRRPESCRGDREP